MGGGSGKRARCLAFRDLPPAHAERMNTGHSSIAAKAYLLPALRGGPLFKGNA